MILKSTKYIFMTKVSHTVAEYRAELPHVRMIDTDDGSTKHFKH